MNKAVLISEEKYKRMLDQIASQEKSNEGLPQTEENKFKLLQPQPLEHDSEISTVKRESPNNEMDLTIINVLPDRYQKKAKRIVDFIKTYGKEILKWRRNGEIEYHNQIIPNSHIADLISDVIHQRKYPPSGHEIFYKALQEMHLPEVLIGSESRRQKVRDNRKETQYNKPEKKELNKSWIKY